MGHSCRSYNSTRSASPLRNPLRLKALLPCEGGRLTIDRRDVLTGLAATAASPALAQSSDVAQSDAQMSQAKPLADILNEMFTPLVSVAILSKALAENGDGNLTAKQVEFASTINTASTELLDLFRQIRDISKKNVS